MYHVGGKICRDIGEKVRMLTEVLAEDKHEGFRPEKNLLDHISG